MNTEINLAIKHERNKTFATTASIRKIQLFAVGLLFLVGVLSAGLFLVIAASPLQSLRQDQTEAANTLNRYQTQFGKNLLVKNQLVAIQDVLAERPDLSTSISTFLSLLPSGIVLTSIDLTETTVAMSIETTSLIALTSLFSQIEEKAQSQEIPANVHAGGIAFSPSTGRYTVSINFQ